MTETQKEALQRLNEAIVVIAEYNNVNQIPLMYKNESGMYLLKEVDYDNVESKYKFGLYTDDSIEVILNTFETAMSMANCTIICNYPSGIKGFMEKTGILMVYQQTQEEPIDLIRPKVKFEGGDINTIIEHIGGKENVKPFIINNIDVMKMIDDSIKTDTPSLRQMLAEITELHDEFDESSSKCKTCGQFDICKENAEAREKSFGEEITEEIEEEMKDKNEEDIE